MARKIAKKKPLSKTPARKTTLPPKAVAKTPVRNSSIPKTAGPAKSVSAVASQPRVVTHEMISVRAFEISCGPNCSSETENWLRAERELRGGI